MKYSQLIKKSKKTKYNKNGMQVIMQQARQFHTDQKFEEVDNEEFRKLSKG